MPSLGVDLFYEACAGDRAFRLKHLNVLLQPAAGQPSLSASNIAAITVWAPRSPPRRSNRTCSSFLLPSCEQCQIDMPPKKAGRKLPPYDWDWVGSEARTVEEITEDQLRRAAGWQGGGSCPSRFAGPSKGGDLGKKGKKPVKDAACGEKKCEGNPRCYNHLGAEDVGHHRWQRKEVDGSRCIARMPKKLGCSRS